MRSLSRLSFQLGLGAIIFGLGALHAGRNDYSFPGTFRFPWLVAFFLLVSVLSYGLAVPDVGETWGGWRRATAATLGSVGVISTAQLLKGTPLLPRSVLLGAILLVPWWGALTSYVAGAGQRQRAARDRVLAVVSEAEAERLQVDLNRATQREATLVSVIGVEAASANLSKIAIDSKATIVVLGRTAMDSETIVSQVSDLHVAGFRVRALVTFYEEWIGKLPVAELSRSSLLFDISDVHRITYRRASRGLDIAVAVLAWPGLLLLLPVVFFGNLVGNRGPLLFRQSRVGRNGREFNIVKFRSMLPGSASSDWTTEGDARITSFGKILRATHIDEVPQLLNILRGDISLVGPRPEQPRYVEQLKTSIPFYDLRHAVQPGLTGWAQVNYSYGNTELDALEKLQFEFYYLRHQGIWLDLRIIARTVQSVVGRKGQ